MLEAHEADTGETAAQLRRVLRLDGEDDALGLEALGGEGGAFGMANRLWGERTYAFLPDFVEHIGDRYDGGLEQVDFVGDAEGARARINGWVETATEGRVVDLLPPDAVSAATRLAIVNAVPFRGTWARPSVFHQAFVAVDEEGTEAAAATGAVMLPVSASPPPPVFRADRPFLFLIRAVATGDVVFLGRLVDPAER